jgi:hypothetical protein
MTKSEKVLLGLGLLGLGVILFLKRRAISDLATSALDAVNDAVFRASIPGAAAPYADVIKQVAKEKGVDPFLISALGWRETRWGTVRGQGGSTGPSIIGSDGTGHGLMQIDSGTWGSWIDSHDWADPYTNVSKGVDIYLQGLDYFTSRGLEGDMATQAALAAYNHGPQSVWKNIQAGLSPDTGTTGGNYASDVWATIQNWAGSFASSVGAGGEGEQMAGWQDSGGFRQV